MTATTNPTHDAAVVYAARGFRVIPLHTAYNGICSCSDGRTCKSAGKHPMRAEWQKSNQPGEVAMTNWWTGDKPRNIGIVTGPASDLLVLDVDGDQGSATLAQLVKDNGPLPRTLTAKTGSGGWHFFFTYPDFEVGNSAGKLGKGLDTRGKGGYVVAAPSVSAKGGYSWVEQRGEDIADAPDWLLEKLRPKQRQATTTAPSQPVPADTPEARRLEGYTRGAVEHELGRLRALEAAGWTQPWNNTLFEVCANLHQLQLASWNTYQSARADILDAMPRDDGMTDEVIHRTFDSAYKKVAGEPAAYPPKPIDLLDHFAGSDLNVEPPAATVKETASPAEDQADGFTSVVHETPKIDIPTIAGIPALHDRLDPSMAAKAAAKTLGMSYSSTAIIDVEHKEIELPLDNLIDRVIRADHEAQAAFHEWLKRNLRSSDLQTFWTVMGEIQRGTQTDAPTIVIKNGGTILAGITRHLDARIGDQEEAILLGLRISTRDVEGPHIVFSFDDEPAPPFDIRWCAPDEYPAPLKAAEDDPDTIVRAPDYRAMLLERARAGLAPQRREAVSTHGQEDA